MKILNLFAGIGGNRTLWGNEHDITAVDNDQQVAMIYLKRFPNDVVIVGDAYQYLEQHYSEFDFIWASPPCPTHSLLCNAQHRKRLPDMRLYGIIIFLQKWFKGNWVVENVDPYYSPLINPMINLNRHLFWSNFIIKNKRFRKYPKDFSRGMQLIDLCNYHSVDVKLIMSLSLKKWSNHDGKRQILRNCVLPEIGQYILDSIHEKNLKEFL